MKKILLSLVALACLGTANAQFYNVGTANHAGRVNLHIGMNNISSGMTYYSPKTADDWGTYGLVERTPENIDYKPGFYVGFTTSTLRDRTETFKLGASLDVFYGTHSASATFNGSVTKPNAVYEFENKISAIDVAIALAGELTLAEKFGIAFDLGPYVDALVGQKVRSVETVGAASNEVDWHDAEKSSMAMPNIDFGIMGRLGFNYHFSETMWVGAAAQYNLPVFSFGGSGFEDDRIRQMDYNFSYKSDKRKSWALMLTFGIDIM